MFRNDFDMSFSGLVKSLRLFFFRTHAILAHQCEVLFAYYQVVRFTGYAGLYNTAYISC